MGGDRGTGTHDRGVHMGKLLRAENAYYNLPNGHREVIEAIEEANGECDQEEGYFHDVDVVYSARLRVRDAFCMRCGKDLTIPPRHQAAPGMRLMGHPTTGAKCPDHQGSDVTKAA